MHWLSMPPVRSICCHRPGLPLPSVSIQPGYRSVEAFQQNSYKTYRTRVVKAASGDRVALWHGDSGYDAWDADVEVRGTAW